MSINFRKIKESDNEAMAKIIRGVTKSFGLDKPGTVYTDASTDNLFALFSLKNAVYWVAEEEEKLVGGGGIYPTEGLPLGCVELVKLYLLEQTRGRGLGKKLMEKCIQSAKEMGFNQIYLESFPELKVAIAMYEKMGFKRLSAPLGNSGHFACNVWMVLAI